MVISTLLSKVSFGPKKNANKNKEYFETVKKVFIKLNTIKEVQVILKVIASIHDSCLLFDFEDTSVNAIHDGKTQYKDFQIKFWAKNLLDKEKRQDYVGKIAHELCHLAMLCVFTNDCKPFRQDDIERQLKFQRIVLYCQEEAKDDELFSSIYNYSIDCWHTETIVCVPQLLAVHMNDLERIKKYRESFSDLFEFFVDDVVPEIERELPRLIEEKQVSELNEADGTVKTLKAAKVTEIVNLELDAINKVLVLSSNSVETTMIAISRKCEIQAKSPSLIFTHLQSFRNPKIFELIVKSYSFRIAPTIVISCEKENLESIEKTFEKLESKGIRERIVFVAGTHLEIRKLKFLYEEVPVEHLFQQLAEETQQKVLNRKINFQGYKINLMELLKSSTVPHNLLAFLTEDDYELVIGKRVGSEINFHVDRIFLTKYEDGTTAKLKIDELLKIAETTKILLLSDGNGAGKSTELKEAAIKLKRNFSSFWVEYLNLKQFTTVFQKTGKISIDFDDSEKIALFVAGKMLKLNLDSLSLEIFVELFNGGRVILLMDGIDEISSSYKDFVIKLMTGIRTFSSNRLLITSQLQTSKELEEKFGLTAMKLQQWSNENRWEFLMKFVISNEVERAKVKYILESIEKFLAKLERKTSDSFVSNLSANFSKIYDDFIKKSLSKIASEHLTSTVGSEQITSTLKSRVDKIKLHKDIASGDLQKVKSFIEKYPQEKFAVDKDMSAIATALSCGASEIYGTLFSHGFKLASHENLEQICKFEQREGIEVVAKKLKLDDKNPDNSWSRVKSSLENFQLQKLEEENRISLKQEFWGESSATSTNLEKSDLSQKSKVLRDLTSNDLIINPLLLRMIAEVFINDFNQNSFSVFEKVSVKMFEYYKAKESSNPVRSRLDFEVLYVTKQQQKIALEHMFNRCCDDNISRTLNLCFRSFSAPFDESIPINFLSTDSFGKYQFVHESVAEFLVAKFFVQQILLLNYENIEVFKSALEVFKIVLRGTAEFKNVLSFLNEAVDTIEFEENKLTAEVKQIFERTFDAKSLNQKFRNLTDFIRRNFMG